MFWNKKQKKIINYKIIEEPTKTLLEEEVRRYINKGWQPVGSAVSGGQFVYYQTMIVIGK